MVKQSLKAFGLVAAILLTSGPALAGETRLAAYMPRADTQPATAGACTDPRGDLIAAASAARVPINVEQIVTATSEKVAVTATSVAGFEQVPATRFPVGVDVGFVYLNAPESGIPAGFYRLNARASSTDVRVGTYPGSVSLFSGDGREVARLPATMETSSLQVPQPLPFARTLVDARIDTSNPAAPARIIIIIRCPNGTTIIIIIGRA